MNANDASAAPLSLRLLGPFEAQAYGQPLPRLRYRKSHAVLALLALRQGGEVERGWLAAVNCGLWAWIGERLPERPRHAPTSPARRRTGCAR